MKSSYILTSIALLLASLLAAGQANEQAEPQRSRVTKGYYSIGNSTPVAGAGTPLSAGSSLTTGVLKGYYSMQPDSQKISSGWLPKRGKPVIKKGYYSIGDHLNRFPRPERK